MAIAAPPRLLIADEPTTSLDLTIQAQYLNLLKELQQRHRLAMIFVTHDLSIVARMCDRVAVMYAGRIVEMGPVRRIFRSPAHPYTRALLDSIPRLGARLERLTVIEGQPPDLARLPDDAPSPRAAPGHGAVPCGGPARDGDGRGTGDALLAARTGRTRVTERQDGRLRGPLPPRLPSVGRDTASRACRARGRRAAPPPE
jgi:ABC-type glutathione transport system ATPase component